jgi:hypothetical protein
MPQWDRRKVLTVWCERGLRVPETPIEARDGDFKNFADCTVEGNAQAADFALRVSGDTLTFTDETGPRDFLRCP